MILAYACQLYPFYQCYNDCMKLVVGLGNPGEQYARTRHNVGFMVVEALGKELGITSYEMNTKFEAEVARVGDVFLVKPQTFMNKSGESVQKMLQFYKISSSDLFVVHDDLDILMGDYKISMRGPKVHNGINSVRTMIGSDDFWYVRVGVDGRTLDERGQISGQDYVLKQLQTEEKHVFEQVIGRVAADLKARVI